LCARSFSGSIPESLSSLSSLQLFYLAANDLTGALPSLVNCSGLMYVELSNNHLTGGIPDSWLNLPMTLLDVSFNALSGAFPPALCASLMTCGAYGNPQLKCTDQSCSKCNIQGCNCDSYACTGPSDCAGGLCSTCSGDGPIRYCS
jgi:hypothetical protein